MICSAGKLIVSLASGITTAKVQDSKMFQQVLYDAGNKKNLKLICPIKVYLSTPPDRIKLAEFYYSKIGQELYKDILRTVQAKGFENVKSSVYWCISWRCTIGARKNALLLSAEQKFI